MENKYLNNSFNLYSIFGYLLPGFFLISLVVIDYDFCSVARSYIENKELKLNVLRNSDLKINFIFDYFNSGDFSDFKFISFIIFMFFCYLLGHIVSAISSFVLERYIVKNLITFPTETLFQNIEPKGLCFKTFRKPFTEKIIDKIDESIEVTFGKDIPRSEYYWLCYSYIITSRPYLATRIHHFVNLYGFSRNIVGSIIIYLFFRLFVLNWHLNSDMDSCSWFVFFILLFSAGVMFWNYLKLFKRQTVDTFFLFLSIKNDTDSCKNDPE